MGVCACDNVCVGVHVPERVSLGVTDAVPLCVVDAVCVAVALPVDVPVKDPDPVDVAVCVSV